jgi:hypothetical protein
MCPEALTTVGRLCGLTFVDLMASSFIGGRAFDGFFGGNFISEDGVG